MWHGARFCLGERARAGLSARCTGSQAKDRLLQLVATMPMERTHLPAAQKQRAQISAQIAERADKYSASSVYAQVLGSGAPGAPASLYLFTDQKRYLFNCGEGTQRLAHEHKVKLSRLEHIFITSKSWRHLGGLPGVSLTLQDVGVPNITLHGPPGLDELYHATRRFVVMKDMKVSMAPCTPTQDFEDSIMTVKYVLIGPDDNLFATDPAAKKRKLSREGASEFEEDDTDYYSRERHLPGAARSKSPPHKSSCRTSPDRQPNVSQHMSKNKTEQLLSSLSKKSTCTVSYICTLKKRLGTLDLNACVERGVRPGPLLGLLKQGKDVLLDDGRLVLSADVKTPDQLGPVFIVLDVPDLAHLNEADFKSHFADGKNPPEDVPALIVHFTPQHIIDDARYQSFLRKFGMTTQHLVVNGSNSCTGSVAVHRMQHKLHLLDTDIFPLLRDTSVPAEWSQPPATDDHSEQLTNKIALAQFESILNNRMCGNLVPSSKVEENEQEKEDKLVFHTARTLTMFHLRPKIVLDRSMEPKLNIQEYISETMKVEGFPESLKTLRRLVEARRAAPAPLPARHPRLLFLGTGSCIPNKTRNTSAILLHLDESRCMLLDCGEGTYGQLVRFYGPEQVDRVLASLRAIYVSHLHADHHIGLIGVLQGRRRALEAVRGGGGGAEGGSGAAGAEHAPLHLLAPGQIMTWLSIYDQQFERIRADFHLIPNQALLVNAPPGSSESAGLTPAVLADIGLSAVRTCQVPHCPNSFGVALVTPAGHKITYSGDTLPSDELVDLGEESTLLIHEATMEDELAGEARAKMHSTTSQAVGVGRRMRARHTLLTHFSQRYARLPRLGDALLGDAAAAVGIAFDNMQVRMEDLAVLPHMYAPLQLMFAEHCSELELKAAKRARRRDLEARAARAASPAAASPPRRRPAAPAAADIERVSGQIARMPNDLSTPKKIENKKGSSVLKVDSVPRNFATREVSPSKRFQQQASFISGGRYKLKIENSQRNSKIMDKTLKTQSKIYSSSLRKYVMQLKNDVKPENESFATVSHKVHENEESAPSFTKCIGKDLISQRRAAMTSTNDSTHLNKSLNSSPTRHTVSGTTSPTKLAPMKKGVSTTPYSLSTNASPTKLSSQCCPPPSRLSSASSYLNSNRQASNSKAIENFKFAERNSVVTKSAVTAANVETTKSRPAWQKDLHKSAKYKEAAACNSKLPGPPMKEVLKSAYNGFTENIRAHWQ